jgi:ABC-2 type transport system ATP-binding protein
MTTGLEFQVDNLVKVYGQQRALDGISFTVPPGQVVGFLGPNGAGKSTTMKIALGYLPPTSGTVRLGRFDVREQPIELQRRIGYLPEHNPLYPDLYVHEYLRLAARLTGVPAASRRNRIADIVEQTGLGPEQHKKIAASKGYRKRVGLAQALLHDPPVLVLDEPTDGLDVIQGLEIRALIHSFAQDKTVLFSSHILSEVETMASRVVIIHQGQVLADGPIAELSSVAGPTQHLLLELTPADAEAAWLTELAGVQHIDELGAGRYRLTIDRQHDVQAAVYAGCVSRNLTLRGLTLEETRLEDIFRQLAQPQS